MKRSLSDEKVLIIVPAYNESQAIKSTIKEIKSFFSYVDILVVDDGSTDTTRQEAIKEGVMVVSLPFNLGIGGAIQTGFKFAYEKGYSIAVQIDGDGQHDAHYLSKLLELAIDNKYDMVIGSRFIENNKGFKSSIARRAGIRFFSWLIGALTKTYVADPTSGFRVYSKKMINIFARYYPHDFPEPEAIVVARRYNAKIKEVAVQMRERKTGYSSIRYLKTLYYMIKVTFAIMLDGLKGKRSF